MHALDDLREQGRDTKDFQFVADRSLVQAEWRNTV